MSLPLLIIPGDCVEIERLRLIAIIYNLPYRDFLFLYIILSSSIYCGFCEVTRKFFCSSDAPVPHNNASMKESAC